jgi:hypothetical protein
MMRCRFILPFLLFLSCGGSAETQEVDENRTVTKAGGTCGEWQLEPGGGPKITHVHADCSQGMTCVGMVVVYPPGEGGNHFGTCLPTDAQQCDPGAIPVACPQGFSCWIGPGIAPPGRCFAACDTNSQCEGPYQACRSGLTCEFLRCPLPGEADASTTAACPSGTRCERGICTQH